MVLENRWNVISDEAGLTGVVRIVYTPFQQYISCTVCMCGSRWLYLRYYKACPFCTGVNLKLQQWAVRPFTTRLCGLAALHRLFKLLSQTKWALAHAYNRLFIWYCCICVIGDRQHSLGKKGKLIDSFESLNTFFFVYFFLTHLWSPPGTHRYNRPLCSDTSRCSCRALNSRGRSRSHSILRWNRPGSGSAARWWGG